jgi:predicted nucleic acid-binding protein
MESEEDEIVIPSIVLAEIAYLFGRRRVQIGLPMVLEYVSRAANCTVYPLDEAVAGLLPVELNIHDGLIVATALVYREVLKRDVSVVTKDSEIRRSKIVGIVW